MKSELITLDKAGEEEEWLWNFLEDIPYCPKPVTPVCIHYDSQAVIGWAGSMMYNGKSYHIRQRHNTIRELFSSRIITIDYVKSKDNVSDPLTKGLSREGVERTSKGMVLRPRTSQHGVAHENTHPLWINLSLGAMEEYLLDDSYSDSFVHNDTVVLRTDPTGQRGMVIGLNRYFDLLGENQFYGNVSSSNIRRVREFVIGDYVVLDHWLGLGVLTNSLKCLATKVTVGSVVINWIKCAGTGPAYSIVPNAEQNPNILTLLSCICYLTWRLRDFCIYHPSEHDLRVEETSFLIVKTRTSLDIMWQDGSIERYIDSTSVMPFEVLGDQEFFPEQFVSEKYFNDVGSSRVGVVKNANTKERIATIRWVNQNTTVGEPISFEMEELTSMYNLKLHPPWNYCYGNIVTRLEDNESEVLDLSWVGNITGFKDGEVEVTWANQMISMVPPHALHVDRVYDESIDFLELDTTNATNISVEDKDGAATEDEELDILGANWSPEIQNSDQHSKRLEITNNPSDHHFLGESGQEAHFHSGGWQINPNLYEKGSICLSLLGTWKGSGNEVWDPAASSMFQILLSLQGLVLNSRPYFNEAGYDKDIGTPEGKRIQYTTTKMPFS
ncbi:hypothetical protein CQW23_12818 [Capsicum baccatum]|uniref:UBC core domain-containing protein n=1 Tax=Capsicum baccatum TaxID=33114 RepID=A0A2G2WTV5_CAPBA|nr:hypothetical protein CQW23_12818 [Capsicum baccatum]